MRTSSCRAELFSKQFLTVCHLVASGLFCMQRMPGTIQRRIFLRARRFPVLRDVLPRHPRLPLCDVSQANLRPLHHRNVQEIPPGMFRVQVGGDSRGTWIGIHFDKLFFSFCLKQLNKGTFKEQGDKPYCHECFDRLFG